MVCPGCLAKPAFDFLTVQLSWALIRGGQLFTAAIYSKSGGELFLRLLMLPRFYCA
jgi:hypothetical protein